MASIVTGKLPSKESELSALRRAINVERRARYSDFQGKHSTFSHFMRQTAGRLCRAYPADSVWTTILGLFREYPNCDVGTRIPIIRRAEEVLEAYWRPYASPERGSQERGSLSASQEGSNGSLPSPGQAETTLPASVQPNRASNKNLPAPVAGSGAAARPKLTQPPDEIPVQFVKGVGPKGAAVLAKLGIVNLRDLLKHYPKRHLDFKNRLRIKDLQEGQEVTIFGETRSVGAFQSKRGNLSIISILISDGTGSITVTRFVGGRSNRYLMERY